MRRDIELRALNAWPALEALEHDGWVFRFARGHTKRANSVTPLHPSALPLAPKIDEAERFYRARGQPAIFKLNSFADGAADLDERLARRGYRLVDPTSVRLMALAGASFASDHEVRLSEAAGDPWVAGVAGMSGLDAPARWTLLEMMRRIEPERRFAAIWRDGRMIAAGLGVLEQGALGLFEIVTDPEIRRQGLARRVLEGLLAWACERGAGEAYLQVVAANRPAIALYERLGFQEIYHYHYRVQVA